MSALGPDRYDGSLADIEGGGILMLEDLEHTWRLTGDWRADDAPAAVAMRIKQ